MMIRKGINIKLLIPLILFFLGIVFKIDAQESKTKHGVVSYITGKSIYVKFESTTGIEKGDTLFIINVEKLVPALIVQHKSSISCLCNPIGDLSFKVSDTIISNRRYLKVNDLLEIQPENRIEKDVSEMVLTAAKTENPKSKSSQNINGRLSLSSYSNFSNATGNDLHRFRYTFSMKALNVSDSKISAETYISFSHKLNQWDVVQDNLNNALKIYNLAINYAFNETTSLWVGRKINPKIANVGAIDGFQFQTQMNHFYVGAVAGTRPDFQDYGFNPNLFEYGAYIGHNKKVENGFVQTSLAFFEQRNSWKIDRRFVYFQHSNSSLKNVNIFSSFELDLYKLENGEPKNTVSLIGLYLSARYRVSRRLSFFGSYDSRQNVIYYETFKNYADRILQLASRQGIRFRINYRPVNYLNLGLTAGTRFRKDDPRPTKTINGNATYSRIPGINASLTLSTNLMQTSYLDGQVFGARLSKDILPGKLYTSLNYRWVNFNYRNSISNLKQNIGEIDFSYHFNKKLYLSVNFEATFQERDNFNRVYLNLRRKF